MAQHPDERRRLVADPDGWPNAVEELLRIEAIVPIGHRQPRGDFTICGREIPAGTPIHPLWASANLDPEVFPDPLTVDLSREPTPHLSFAAVIPPIPAAHLPTAARAAALVHVQRPPPASTTD